MIDIVILAAGKGTRMRSNLPKVLQSLAGKPMLGHVLDQAVGLANARIHVIVGHGGESVQSYCEAYSLESGSSTPKIQCIYQQEQLGTGHAVQQSLPFLESGGKTLILYGDVPLTSAALLQRLVNLVDNNSLGLLTVELNDPTGYGRIIRDEHGAVARIVEQKDANEKQLKVKEVNTGIIAANTDDLLAWLPTLSNDNAQGELYLTDIIEIAVGAGRVIATEQPETEMEVMGVNNRAQQAQLERFVQQQRTQNLMEQGVCIADPTRVDIRGEVHCGQDVFIDINAVFIGNVELGKNVCIEPNCVVINTKIGDNVTIKANSHIEDAIIHGENEIGPFARIRPGTELESGAKIGNFVETKKSKIGEGSKVNHLSYIGDSEVGSGVNIGAGTITCNYDGANKFKTIIEDGAFIGSNSALVAPVTIGKEATVGAGSTITRDVPEQQLSVTRAKQRDFKDWVRPTKKS
ncbi:bifunctional UDP-N-acetylglucosamine diphosphorylase/glucosamine-1-phosphate N-acetyltransferase GlmU [Marinibactrum halimedae]|uniref:Bifunctional protein GlmU n=1 Tax=Marinibactrum halimedae TaxID=1444977 RepID=A0AA37T9I4_9GAMM|nr:bifunctional UDP-N-acetylglucosamine diphosphorylase/glucosamine-1-phosphate N-acetyltransferase GlmU [Marinibactrum halimedae]MCD9460000.1 bifunctional UDP-N-acetylglucosamine diphosphorylase/glucosamine-1-phosphate N-acetyltransferase GlmU [Marinibactrum halimedae]GLS28231.1 bifunctional protein GlmU [Marinibactrum halimedae]